MKHRFKNKLSFAHFLKENITNRKLISHNQMAIGKSLFIAESDDTTFRELFNEAMPPHLKQTLKLEIYMWETLRNSLNSFAQSDFSFERYKRETTRFKEFIKLLIKVIEIEIEILYSPLVNHFQSMLADIERRLK